MTTLRALFARPLCLAAIAVLFLAACAAPGSTPPTVILISLDGFRWDYLDRTQSPHLHRLAAEGVRAKGLIPVFPSKTFPNHYSIVTGLYPEDHGIVANTIYDPETDSWFGIGDQEAVTDSRWWGGEPIWVGAVRQGKKSATMFWPGSEAEIGGVRPTFWIPYDGQVPGEGRVAQVLEWLDKPADERPAFLATYFSLTDERGHEFGPHSAEVIAAVEQVDAWIGLLIQGLEERGIYDQVHVILVSDHGMAEMSPDRIVFLDDYLDLSRARVVDWNPVAAIRPEPDYLQEAYQSLGQASNLTVYLKEEVPERLRYSRNRLIPPLLALADEGWAISSRVRESSRTRDSSLGAHGFDNQYQSMQGLFIGRGPRFRSGYLSEPFLCIHLYPLMSEILGINPAPNDGSLEAVQDLLR